ncbi:ATP-binding protein [Streptomyces natalensis]|uniref:ATP-binding protein n=1 Tax=Streptomyces natalensis TaxID=68242 RepID=UPI0006999DD1|nr:ATP-binding protein [Streptomyces natalensis]
MTPHPEGTTAPLIPVEPLSHLLAQATGTPTLPTGDSGHDPTEFAACALTADQQAAGKARRFTWATLSGWQLGPLVDNAALVVSELLTNALRYGLPTSAARTTTCPRPLWLGLLRRPDLVLCTVCDHSTQVPLLKTPDHLAQSGRGLHIVNCLSQSWGWTTPTVAGKAVWAALSIAEHDARSADPPRCPPC